MKKLFAIVLCVLLVGVIGLTAFAANDTKIIVTADKTAVQRGDTVTVTVSVSGSDPFTSLGYIQDRDSAYFTVSTGVMQPALEQDCIPTIKSFTQSSGFAAGGFWDPDAEEYVAVTVNGDVLVLTLTIKDDAPFGSFTVTDLVNVMNNTTEVPFTLVEDTITVISGHSYTPENTGDADTHKLVCGDCGDTQTEPHIWDEGKVTDVPTVDKEGEMTFTCICGATETQPIPKLDPPAEEFTSITVTVDKTTVHRGDTVNVEILLEGNALWSSMGYRPHSDSSYYTIGRHTFGEALSEPGSASVMNFSKKDGLLVAGYTDYDTEQDISVTVNGVILSFPITIKDDAPFGSFTVTKDANAKNGSKVLQITLQEESITVVCDHRNSTCTPLDEESHSLVCPDCQLNETVAHNCINGTCADCGWKEPYLVIFADEDGTELSRATYYYGDTVVAPAAPTKAADKTFTYTFDGWDEDVVPVTGSTTYTATYKATYIDYTITFVHEDGTVIATGTYHYGDTVTVPADPTKENTSAVTYKFIGWDKQIVPVEDNATYTAQFESINKIPDLDGNGELTDADAVYLLRHTLFPEDYPANMDMDINCDGEVTDADAVYMLRHTLFPELYPLYPKNSNQ